MAIYSAYNIMLFSASTIFLLPQLSFAFTGCPLDLSRTNFTLVASSCSNPNERGECCRYINAFVAISAAYYANITNKLGVSSDLYEVCVNSVSKTFELYGMPSNATSFCGIGTKIPTNYECKGRTSVTQMLQSPGFDGVARNCQVSILGASECKKCINASVMYLHQITLAEDKDTMIKCRDAAFVTLASQSGNASAAGFARCFFGVPGLISSVSEPLSSPLSPMASPSPLVAASPSEMSLGSLYENHQPHQHTAITGVGIGVTIISFLLMLVLVFLIRRKSRELNGSENNLKAIKASSCRSGRKIQEGKK